MYYSGKACVLDLPQVKKKIPSEYHDTPLADHLGIHWTLVLNFFWPTCIIILSNVFLTMVKKSPYEYLLILKLWCAKLAPCCYGSFTILKHIVHLHIVLIILMVSMFILFSMLSHIKELIGLDDNIVTIKDLVTH